MSSNKAKHNQDAIKMAQADLWDDTLLIKRYDESMRLAREEVAKRIAQSTNTATENDQSATESDSSSPEQKNPGEPVQYKVGDYVRCTYSEDGIDYEAIIVSVKDGQCTVKYLGYDNEEEVDLAELIPSWGKKERRAQMVKSLAASAEEGEVTVQTTIRAPKAKAPKTTKREHAGCSTFERYGTSMMIPPPPPMPNIEDEMSEDSEHLSAMLMAWYMSGYYTGLYQGRRQAGARSASKK